MEETEQKKIAPLQHVGGDLIIPAVALVFAIYYLITIWDLTWEAQLNGFMVGGVLLLLVALFFVRTTLTVLRGEGDLGLGSLWHPRSLQLLRLALLLLSVAFILVIEYLGFTLSVFIFMLSALYLLGERSPSKLVGIPLILSGGGYLLFILLLDTRFPRGPFEHLIDWIF